MNLRNIPLRRKLMSIMLITCTAVLVLICSAYIVFEYYSFKKVLKSNVSSLSLVIAANSSAALAFDSEDDATEILSALKNNKNITAAALYDSQGNLFATYPAGLSANQLPSHPAGIGFRFEGDFLVGFQPVIQKNTPLGTLFIKSDLQAMYIQLRNFILIALVLLAGSLIVAYFLSNLLQKNISKPILALERTAKQISSSKDYSIRARSIGRDEIGSLTETFNEMLNQIEQQNQEIVKSKEHNATLAAIVESSGDAIIANNLQNTITNWNEAATSMLGYSGEEMIGQSVLKLIPNNQKALEEKIEELVKNRHRVDPFEIQFITKDQRILDISLNISPIKDNAGNIIGLSQIARNVTEQKQNERLLIDREEHLRLAVQAAELGTFNMDIPTGFIHWDTRCQELLGIYKDASDENNEFHFEGSQQDEKSRISKILLHILSKNRPEGNYDEEYRIEGFNNKVRWVRVKGQVFFNDNKADRFLGAVLDITSQKQEELKKNDFIAIISHELKTPLTSIKSYIQILRARALKEGDEFRLNALARADAQTIKMTSMIKDFLNLSRIEDGKLHIDKKPFDLQPFLEDILAEANFLTPTHTIKIAACGNIKVNGDADKLAQVLINLLSNAVKYSSPGTAIEMGCEPKDGKVEIYVKDEGIGIHQDDQKRLFNRFFRVENNKMKTVSGFGIGLYLVSEILRYHGCKIKVESEEGKGSKFYFMLETTDENP